jgi:hypothetical protein
MKESVTEPGPAVLVRVTTLFGKRAVSKHVFDWKEKAERQGRRQGRRKGLTSRRGVRNRKRWE